MINRIKKIRSFIEGWPGYKKPLTPIERRSLFEPFVNGWPSSQNNDLSIWKTFLNGFKEKYSESLNDIRKNVPQANIIKVLNLGYDELRHSRMLAWLLDKKASHMQGKLFFFHFLDTLGIKKSKEYQGQYYVERERPDRIDISIYSPNKFAIFIENKVRNDERDRQLDDEYNSLKKWSMEWNIGEKNRHLVFLTIDGRSPLSLSEDKNDKYKKTINLDYSTYSKAMRKAASVDECKSPYIRRLVIDYTRQLSQVIKNLSR